MEKKQNDKELKLQAIKEFERILNVDLSSFLVLNEEGKEGGGR